MSDLIGRTVNGYQIIEQIGQGGMATVFKAYQPSLDRNVALKVLPPIYAQQDDSFLERFKREAHVVAKLRHPNILMVMDFGQDDQLTYIVMDYIEAGTLKDRMTEPLTLKQISTLVSQVGEALQYAHSEGVIHRDVKPSNVLLPKPDWALLTDFGLARMVGGSMLTQSGMSVGTPAYMAPEQGSGEHVDARSDVYSLGVMLYEMCTGEVPYTAETPMAVMVKHIVEPLPLPRERNPHLPEMIERIILKAMAKDPNDRFQTALEFVEQLKLAAVEHPTWSTTEIPSPPKPLPIKSKPKAKAPSVKDAPAVDSGGAQVTLEITGLSKWIKPLVVLVAVIGVIAVGYFAYPSLFPADPPDADHPPSSTGAPVDPNFQEALVILSQGREAEASIAFQITLAENPSQWPYFLSAMQEKHANPAQSESTVRLLSSALSNVDHPPAEAYALLGSWLLEADDPQAAQEMYTQAVALPEADVWAWIGLAESNRDLGQAGNALQALDSALPAASGDHAALSSIGWVLLDLDEYQRAADVFKMAIDLNASDAWSYLGLAESYIRSGADLDQAPIVLGMALENAGQEAEVLLYAASLYSDLGDCASARTYFDQALAIDPLLDGAQDGLQGCE